MEDCLRAIKKKTFRAKENILAGLGKTDRTVDTDFSEVKNVYSQQQNNGYQVRKALRDYLVSMKVANDALRNFHDSMNLMYEPELGSAEKLKHLTQDSEASWDQYLNRSEKTFQDVARYSSVFAPTKEKIAKRSRKLLDYDMARHAYESVINSPKKTPETVKKVTIELHAARNVYEEMNDDLLNSLPVLHDTRLPFVLKTGRQFFDDAAKFHNQSHTINKELAEFLQSSESTFLAKPPKSHALVRKHLPDVTDITASASMDDISVHKNDENFDYHQDALQADKMTHRSLKKYKSGLKEAAPHITPTFIDYAPTLGKVTVVRKFIAAEPSELSFDAGDTVEILPSEGSLDQGWAFGQNESTGEKGHFSPPHKIAPPGHGNFSTPTSAVRQALNFGAMPASGGSSSPFISTAANSNPKFTAASKVVSKTAATPLEMAPSMPLKPPKPPEKPLTPYMRYSRKVWEKVRSSHPDSKLWDIGKVVGSMWRELTEQAKQSFFDEYEAEKIEYDKSMKIYKHSPAYLAYEQQMQRNKVKVDKASRLQVSSESGVYVQPVDEEEAEETISIGHVASARFQRNQKLMLEIFSSVSVPDLRSVFSTDKVMRVRKQIRSLISHQKNLENELEHIEATFQSKKRSLEESGQNFLNKMQKLTEENKKVEDKGFEEMVVDHQRRLVAAYSEYKTRQATNIPKETCDDISKIVSAVINNMISKIESLDV